MMYILFLGIMALLIAADRLTKLWAATSLATTAGKTVLPNVLNFVYVENRGIAFGMFQNMHNVILPISFVILAVCLYFAWHYYKKRKYLAVTAITLIVAGAVGNIIDKIAYGYVVDFIQAAFVDFPVFNLADVFICVGAGLFAVYLLIFDKEVQNNDHTV